MYLHAHSQARPRLVNGVDDGVLFLTAKGLPLNPKKLSDRVGAYVSAAGLNKTGSCHLFRHTAATLMLENGADIRFIQAMLGHESLDTTQFCTQVGIAKLAAVHAATHPGAMLKREDLLADLSGESDDDNDGYRRGTAGGAGAEKALSCEDDDDADHF